MKWLIVFAALLFTTSAHGLELSDLRCLAEAIYHEARGEPVKGQIAVGVVVMNRVKQSRWPNTPCKVIFQPNQFSWTRGWKTWSYDYSSLLVAAAVLSGAHQLKTFKATHFHSGPQPTWAKDLKIVKKIGNHVFYK